MKNLLSILVVATAVLVCGCATVINGTKQDVGISSSPTNAKVIVDGVLVGRAPLNYKLRRKENHTVRLELDGYQSYETTLTRKVSGWVWGNLAIGGLIGLAVDAISGGIYKLTPEQMQAELRSAATSSLPDNQQLRIAVVLHTDPSWQKIGNLERIVY